jgi:hypothetical protein
MPRKSATMDQKRRLAVELAIAGLGPREISRKTEQAERRVRRVLKAVGLFWEGVRAPPYPPRDGSSRSG